MTHVIKGKMDTMHYRGITIGRWPVPFNKIEYTVQKSQNYIGLLQALPMWNTLRGEAEATL